MKLVVFGLSVSSSWGNGHATLWRGLCRALGRMGHEVVFFERDVPYYAAHRDRTDLPGGRLVLYEHFEDVRPKARAELNGAEVGMVTSYCPDAAEATELVTESPVMLRAFYDLDAPITLDRLRRGEPVEYVGERGFADFDLVLSYSGGPALGEMRTRLGARWAAPLYGSVDPGVHVPAPPDPRYAADLSYLGTYAEDRRAALDRLFLKPARWSPGRRFLIGGALYPPEFPWGRNIAFVRHVPPAQHAAFYSSSRLTLNVTRGAMAAMGYCPSGRLFEAAACGAVIVSDAWPGLGQFFEPGRELFVAHGARDVIELLDASDEELQRCARAARERVLAEHTADHRAQQLERIFERVLAGAADRSGSTDAADPLRSGVGP